MLMRSNGIFHLGSLFIKNQIKVVRFNILISKFSLILNYLISAFIIFITILISTFSCGLKNACSMSCCEEMNGLLHPREGRAPLPMPSFCGPEVLFGNQQTFPKWHHEPAR